MIANLIIRSQPGDLFGYLLGPAKGAVIIGGNKLPPKASVARFQGNVLTDAREVIAELTSFFKDVAQLNPRATKTVLHINLGFAPSDAPSTDRKVEIADLLLHKLGYADNRYLVVHHDRRDPGHTQEHDHDHIHIAASNIRDDGKSVSTSWNYRQAETALRQLEKDFGLEQLPCSWQNRRKPRRVPSRAPLTKKDKIQRSIERHAAPNLSLSLLISQLLKDDVVAIPHFSPEGEWNGMVYEYDGLYVPGCKLTYASAAALTQRGIICDLTDAKIEPGALQSEIIAGTVFEQDPKTIDIDRAISTDVFDRDPTINDRYVLRERHR